MQSMTYLLCHIFAENMTCSPSTFAYQNFHVRRLYFCAPLQSSGGFILKGRFLNIHICLFVLVLKSTSAPLTFLTVDFCNALEVFLSVEEYTPAETEYFFSGLMKTEVFSGPKKQFNFQVLLFLAKYT